ncbi:MAG: hypothetical protein R2752_21870 [Vicinamibacterales bacterium]
MRTLIIATGVVLAAALAAAPLHAATRDAYTLRVTVPFPFIAGQRSYPAGMYTLTPETPTDDVLELSSFLHGGFLLVEPAATPLDASINEASGDALVFAKRDGKYVLCQVWEEGTSMGDRIVGSEKVAPIETPRLPSPEGPVTVVVPARRAAR